MQQVVAVDSAPTCSVAAPGPGGGTVFYLADGAGGLDLQDCVAPQAGDRPALCKRTLKLSPFTPRLRCGAPIRSPVVK